MLKWGKYRMQLVFGLPILIFVLVLVSFDAFGKCDIGKFGYAFFGGVISHFLTYFFRKAVQDEATNTSNN